MKQTCTHSWNVEETWGYKQLDTFVVLEVMREVRVPGEREGKQEATRAESRLLTGEKRDEKHRKCHENQRRSYRRAG